MSDFEIIRDEHEGLIRVLNKVTGAFVKNHTQDIIKGKITERLKHGDIRDDDGRVWYDDNNLAYDSEKVKIRLVHCDKQCRAIVAYGIVTGEKTDADMELEEELNLTPFVTVFSTNGKQILNLQRFITTTNEPYFADRATLYEDDFSIHFGSDSIGYTRVSDNYETHNRNKFLGIIDYNGRTLFKKERREDKKPAKQRANELMAELEMGNNE